MIQFKVCFGLFRSNLIGEEFMWDYSCRNSSGFSRGFPFVGRHQPAAYHFGCKSNRKKHNGKTNREKREEKHGFRLPACSHENTKSRFP